MVKWQEAWTHFISPNCEDEHSAPSGVNLENLRTHRIGSSQQEVSHSRRGFHIILCRFEPEFGNGVAGAIVVSENDAYSFGAYN